MYSSIFLKHNIHITYIKYTNARIFFMCTKLLLFILYYIILSHIVIEYRFSKMWRLRHYDMFVGTKLFDVSLISKSSQKNLFKLLIDWLIIILKYIISDWCRMQSNLYYFFLWFIPRARFFCSWFNISSIIYKQLCILYKTIIVITVLVGDYEW